MTVLNLPEEGLSLESPKKIAGWRLGRAIVCLAAVTSTTATAMAQVVINEVVAANSDRLLTRDAPGYPKLGSTVPWHNVAYDDALWKTGNGPFGFGTFPSNTFGVNTSAAMLNKTPVLYLRKKFYATDAMTNSSAQLQLVTRYNDGFIAFINGVEVARRNMGNPGMFAYRDQTAFNTNIISAASEIINLGAANQAGLVKGPNNVLCIQTHNKALSGGDAYTFLSKADLILDVAPPPTLVAHDQAWKYFVGLAEPSGGVVDHGLLAGVPETASWATLGFNDSEWPVATGPVGIDSTADYPLGVNLYSEVHGIAASIYTRSIFTSTSTEATSTNALMLTIDYDDGIIVYLNGKEVARRNVGVTNTITSHDTLATTTHNANGDGGITGREETFSIGPARTLLANGDNILAIQMHNSAVADSDMIARVTLNTSGSGARTLIGPAAETRYFIGIQDPVIEDPEDENEIEDEDPPDSEGDWIELYNAGTGDVLLTNWSLTDDEDQPRKWNFPPGTTIPAGGYVIVMATGYDVGPANGTTYLHANFKLDTSGEYLGLVDASGAIVSELAPDFPKQSYFHSYARNASGQFEYRDIATPGAPNAGAAYSAITSAPNFSHAGGFYSGSLSVQLAAPDPGASIRYTLDGSEPSASTGTLYGGPIAVAANSVIRARCFKSGEIPSKTRTHTYLIGQNAARRSIPAICVASDPVLSIYGPNAAGGPTNGQGIFAIRGGFYTNAIWNYNGDKSAFNVPMQHGRSFEKPSSLEFYPTNGTPLRTDFGLRLSGSPWSRPRYTLTNSPPSRFGISALLKPSFNFYFRDELGDSPEDYPFFPGNPVTKFEDLRVRAGKNDISNPFIKDEMMRRIHIGTGQKGSHGIFNTMFINGVFKGYYNLCEHLREAFMQRHYNSPAAWDVQQTREFVSGDAIHWNQMIAYLRTSNLSNSVAAYAGVHNYLDVDNYIDYLMVNIFAATWDWPNNNWVASHERTDNGRWRFFVWDAEGGFGGANRNPALYDIFIGDTNSDGIADSSEVNYRLDIGAAAKTTTSQYIPAIYTLLKVSPEFRLRFADRAQKHLFHGGCLTKDSMTDVYLSLRNDIDPIMKDTINQYVNGAFYTNWVYTDTRRNTVFAQLTKYGLWPSNSAPEFGQHGGEIEANTLMSISNLNAGGTIYYTTNGADPRAEGGAIVGAPYTAPLTLPASTQLKARVLDGTGQWSPLQDAIFVVPMPVATFLPPTNADWTIDGNWDSAPGPFPNGSGVSTIINAPTIPERIVSLKAPVTIGSIRFEQGATAYCNRLRGGTGNALTLRGSSGAANLIVNGTSTGYVEIDVAADVILDTDLRIEVNNIEGNFEYGALRLRDDWYGTGGLIKEGYGLASLTGDSKTYTGETVINQGVLQTTYSAAPTQSSAIRVNPGGQLRLSSDGLDRVYYFGGDITLNSMGRGGPIPDESHRGILGALRFDPESDNSWATITNRIFFAGPCDLHVDGTVNTMELTGPLSGEDGFVKTGGGTLVLGGISPGYVAPVILSNGTLTVNGHIASDVQLVAGTKISGSGQVGDLDGAGSVALDKTVLVADSSSGLNYGFAFNQPGSPNYGLPDASGNAVLRMLSAPPTGSPCTIDIYLDRTSLAAGDRFRGGFFVGAGLDLFQFLNAATVRFFVPNDFGAQLFAGRTYSAYSGALPITITTVPETADFGDGPRNGRVLEIRIAGPPVLYDEWKQSNFPDQSDPLISGPMANPQCDGVVNLLRYAFDINSGMNPVGRMPRLVPGSPTPEFQFYFDPGKNDLAYVVEASGDLLDWSRVLFDSRTDVVSGWTGDLLAVPDDAYGAGQPMQFYRLNILWTAP